MGLLDPVLGPMLMGTFASVFAFGIMVVQCHLYFIWFKKDKLRVKFTVAFLLLLDTVSVAFYVGAIYNYLVTNFDNPAGIATLNFGLTPYPLFTGLTAFVVQCYFGWTIQVLTGTYAISGCIYMGSFIQFLASIGTTIGGSIVRQFTELQKTKAVALVWLSGSLLTDLVITVTLVVWLRRNRTGMNGSDDIISRLNRVFLQTGLLTTSFALGVIISFLISNRNAIQFAFGIPQSKLYTISLMSTLNGRRGWIPPNAQDGFSIFTAKEGTDDSQGLRRSIRDSKQNVNGRTGLSVVVTTTTDVQDIELQDTDKDSLTKVGRFNVLPVLEEDETDMGC